jgi:hypothetical protein
LHGNDLNDRAMIETLIVNALLCVPVIV